MKVQLAKSGWSKSSWQSPDERRKSVAVAVAVAENKSEQRKLRVVHAAVMCFLLLFTMIKVSNKRRKLEKLFFCF